MLQKAANTYASSDRLGGHQWAFNQTYCTVNGDKQPFSRSYLQEGRGLALQLRRPRSTLPSIANGPLPLVVRASTFLTCFDEPLLRPATAARPLAN